MKNVYQISFVVCSLSALSAQAQSDFDSLVAVEGENILKNVEIEESTVETSMQFVSEDPKIRVVPSSSWNEEFAQSQFSITEVTDNSMTLLSDDGEELTIQMQPAEHFEEFLEGKEGRTVEIQGELSNTSFSADQDLRLFLGDTLALGYVWKTAGQPVSILDHDGIAIVQQLALADLPGGDSIALVPVQVNTDDGMIEIPSGETVDFYHNGIPYQVYVVFSEYQPSSYDGEDSRSGYLFHAIVTSGSSSDEQELQEITQDVVLQNERVQGVAKDPETLVKVYPNPATGYVIFEVENLVPVLLEIYDITGHKALVIPLSKARNLVNAEKNGLGKGMYFWIVKDNAGELVQSGKIAIQ